MRRIADEIGTAQGLRPIIVCDNTLLGPVFQHPLEHGADVSLYSLTNMSAAIPTLSPARRWARGRSCGRSRRCAAASARQLDPHSCWMLGRSLETLAIRMERANTNARLVAEFLRDHPRVAKVHYLEFLEPGSPAQATYARQCTGAGSTFAFDIKGGQTEAFAFLNALQVFKLAVSLGGTDRWRAIPPP